jgi:hypothetical protein
MRYLKVKDNDELVRDEANKAILNIDNDALKQYKERKRKEASLLAMLKEHEELKEDVKELKSLLLEVLGKLK